jgi:hypothetical protein
VLPRPEPLLLVVQALPRPEPLLAVQVLPRPEPLLAVQALVAQVLPRLLPLHPA